MANKAITGDLSVFSVGGSSLLASLKNVTYKMDFDTEDGSTVLVQGRQLQKGKRGGTIETTLFSTVSDGVRVESLDCSVFTIDAVDYLPLLKSLRFNIENELKDTSGAADAWKYMQWMGKKDYKGTIDLYLPVLAGGALAAAAHNADRTLTNLVVSFTLNGVAITLPIALHSFEHQFTNGEEQLWRCEFSGKAPDTLATAYPTAPTGTTSLLEKAFNAPGTALAFGLTSHATEGVAYSGNMMIQSASFEIADGKVVETQYTFATQGAVTAAQN